MDHAYRATSLRQWGTVLLSSLLCPAVGVVHNGWQRGLRGGSAYLLCVCLLIRPRAHSSHSKYKEKAGQSSLFSINDNMTNCNLALLAILVGGVNSQVNRDPCLVCPDGVTAMFEGMAPDANFGDNSTCAELIAAAMLLESGTEDCAWADKHGLLCCPTVPNNPCIICPAGIMDGRENELVPLFSNNNDPSDETCALLSEFAKQFETSSNLCQMFGLEQESTCCNSDTTTVDTTDVDTTTDAPVFNADPCLVCPDGVLAGYDGLAPYAISGDGRTCSELIVDARRFELGTGDCAWAEKHELYCCPAVPMNPCIICPAGIIVGHESELVPEYHDNNDPRDET